MANTNQMTSYFDESCVDGRDRYAVIAGFLATTDIWQLFEPKYAELLGKVPPGISDKRYGRAKLGMDEQRIQHAREVATLAASMSLRAIVTVLDTEAFRPVFLRFAKARDASILLSNAYSTCAFYCCELIDAWAERDGINNAVPIKTIFDEGAPHWDQFNRGYRKYYGHKVETTHLDPIPIPQSDETVLQLKAADQFAWFISRNWNLGEQGEILEIFQQQLDGSTSFGVLSDSHAEEILRRLDLQEQGVNGIG